MGTFTLRRGATQEFLVVIQMVVSTIKRLSGVPGSRSKTSPSKRKASWDFVHVRSRLQLDCHGLQSGSTLEFSLWLSDFKTKTSFRFLSKKSGVVSYFSENSKNELVRPKNGFFGDFSKNLMVL